MNLRKKSELANSILEKETSYFKDKNIIYGFFTNSKDKLTKENIEAQLTVIDSYYSTNMSRRYYGIEEVAESILKISNSKDELKNKFIEYPKTSNHSNEITNLFHKKYGYNKKGKSVGRSMSLISKYAYFITDFNFPIYDSIVREVYPLLSEGNKLNDSKFDKFVTSMNKLLQFSQIDDFNKLDNLLWLIGKINRGNYSLILKKSNYLELVAKIDNLDSFKSNEIDMKIRDYINNNIDDLSNIFTDRQRKMIKFSNKLTKNKA